jgi:hypothetical protein
MKLLFQLLLAQMLPQHPAAHGLLPMRGNRQPEFEVKFLICPRYFLVVMGKKGACEKTKEIIPLDPVQYHQYSKCISFAGSPSISSD